MTDQELDDLEAKAKAAKPGPWDALPQGDGRSSLWSLGPGFDPYDSGQVSDWVPDLDAAFIAAANPQTVLDLVAEIRRLRGGDGR